MVLEFSVRSFVVYEFLFVEFTVRGFMIYEFVVLEFIVRGFMVFDFRGFGFRVYGFMVRGSDSCIQLVADSLLERILLLTYRVHE